MVRKGALLGAGFGVLLALNGPATFGAPPATAPGSTPPPAAAPVVPPVSVPAPVVKSAPPISAESYLNDLRQAEKQLNALEQNPARPYGVAAKAFPPAAKIKRGDGETQTAGKIDPAGLLSPTKGPPPKAGEQLTRNEVRTLRDNLVQRRRSIEDWLQKRDGNYYQSIDAKRIIQQLENTGQIRTGPTQLQQLWSDIKKWFRDLLDKIARWLFGAGPRSPVKPPAINENVLKFVFYSTVFALLITLVFLLWKSLGGRWRRSEAERRVRYLEGEDAELLRLPPDELRERAARFAAAGNYREALRHLYIATLVKFDARGVWRYDTRRTNWEHIQALRKDKSRLPLVSPMSDLTRRFDRVRYGDAPASQGDWQRFEHDVEIIDGLLDGGSAANAAGVAK